ncbi:beta-ketoacyl-ACP synthase III [Enterococcus sp. LJL90]
MKNYAKITATASYVPANRVTNDQLSEMMETSDEWITSRTGIHARHITTGEDTSDLCIQVAEKLIAENNFSADSLDFIIVATMSPDYTCPSVACMVQGAIGATQAFAFDVTAACSGFVFGLATAEKFIRGGYQRGLVIGGETTSKLLDWEDRSTAVLFGDGAAGVVVEASDVQHFHRELLASDGTRQKSLTAGKKNFDSPFWQEPPTDEYFLQMNGRDIFDFATRDVVKNISAVAAEEKDTIDYYLLHQANERIIDKIARKLKVPREKFLTNMADYGNTSAASIPLLLDEAVQAGTIQLGSNQKLMLTGYGGGLTWGSLLVTV